MGTKRVVTSIVKGTEDALSDTYEKTKKAMLNVADKNADGKIDLKDISTVANKTGIVIKKSASSMKKTVGEYSQDMERRLLQPIFIDDIDSAGFTLSKLIRVCERDKKRADSEVCKGSIGHFTDFKGFRIVNVFHENTDSFGISFFPDKGYDFYYVDPSDRNTYIALDEYFSYLKIARVNELQKIAQDLGAKHFKVTYKEEKVSFSSQKIKANAKANIGKGIYATPDWDRDKQENKFFTVEIAAEMECQGHEPVRPNLKYLSKDTSIQNLIDMRMDEKAPLSHQKFILKLSNSSGIKEKDAVKIDAALKGFKCSGNVTVTSEAKNEARRYLEYEINF